MIEFELDIQSSVMVGCEAEFTFLSDFKCALEYLVWKTSAFLFFSCTEKNILKYLNICTICN